MTKNLPKSRGWSVRIMTMTNPKERVEIVSVKSKCLRLTVRWIRNGRPVGNNGLWSFRWKAIRNDRCMYDVEVAGQPEIITNWWWKDGTFLCKWPQWDLAYKCCLHRCNFQVELQCLKATEESEQVEMKWEGTTTVWTITCSVGVVKCVTWQEGLTAPWLHAIEWPQGPAALSTEDAQ